MRLAALFIILSTAVAAEPQDAASKAKVLKAPLTKISVKKGALRQGAGLKDEIPATAYQAKVAGETILFFDMDNDEKLSPDTDGMAMQYGPFVIPLTDTLMLKTGQYKLSFEDLKSVTLSPEDLGACESLCAEASYFTEIRIRSGLRPPALDAKTCADCEKHCNYLKLNNMNTASAGMKAHTEEQGKPGYTNEGALAGGGGDIFLGPTTLKNAIDTWYRSAWHSVPLLDPTLSRYGAAAKHDCATLYFIQSNFRGSGGAGSKGEYPPDGATNIPCANSGGEIPNPVPGTQGGKGCGLPIYVRYGPTPDAFTLTDASGRAVAGTVSCSTKPANPEHPTNSNITLFIPSKPLAPNTLYKATVKPLGGLEAITWSFTTGSR